MTETEMAAETEVPNCPRCGGPSDTEFWGPCQACVGHLRATVGLNKQAAETQQYVPKMNVTPNNVASKGD